jgi:hypothetical protein
MEDELMAMDNPPPAYGAYKTRRFVSKYQSDRETRLVWVTDGWVTPRLLLSSGFQHPCLATGGVVKVGMCTLIKTALLCLAKM